MGRDDKGKFVSDEDAEQERQFMQDMRITDKLAEHAREANADQADTSSEVYQEALRRHLGKRKRSIKDQQVREAKVQLLEPEDPSELLPVHTDLEQLKLFLKYDTKAFIMLFLADEEGIEKGIPEFHVYGFEQMVRDVEKPIAIAWPRDHAKTTLAKIATVWLLIYTNYRFPVYLSNTNKVATDALKDIADMIRHPLVEQIFGVAKFTQASEAAGDYTLDWCDKRILMRSLGVGQQVRGTNKNNQRPDILIMDDVESAEESEENKLGYAGLKKWFYGTMRKAMDRRKHKIIQIGNFVSNKTLLGDHLKSRFWRSIRLSAITKTGKPLWPARWTINQLRLDLMEYIENGEMQTWLCEMLNMPLNTNSQLVNANKVRFSRERSPDDKAINLKCLTVDPAITKNMQYANACVIVAHGFVGDHWELLEMESVKGIGPFDTYQKIMAMAAKWGIHVVGVEIEGYQEALRQVCEVEAARAGLDFMRFVPLKTFKRSKTSRLVAWGNMLNNGMYHLPMKYFHIVQKMLEYDIHAKHNDDDEPDACAYILQMADLYLEDMANVYRFGAVPETGVTSINNHVNH